jgi:hypothetical protein
MIVARVELHGDAPRAFDIRHLLPLEQHIAQSCIQGCRPGGKHNRATQHVLGTLFVACRKHRSTEHTMRLDQAWLNAQQLLQQFARLHKHATLQQLGSHLQLLHRRS